MFFISCPFPEITGKEVAIFRHGIAAILQNEFPYTVVPILGFIGASELISKAVGEKEDAIAFENLKGIVGKGFFCFLTDGDASNSFQITFELSYFPTSQQVKGTMCSGKLNFLGIQVDPDQRYVHSIPGVCIGRVLAQSISDFFMQQIKQVGG